MSKLVELELVVKGDKKDELETFLVQKSTAQDLPAEKQLGIGGKVHTTRTANPDILNYVGERIQFPYHSLSKQYKAGVKAGYGVVKNWHTNEEGFKYVIVGNEDGSQCAKKSSSLLLVDATGTPYANQADAPTPTENFQIGVRYKKGAEDFVTHYEQEEFPTINDGLKVIFVFTTWSPNSKLASKLVESYKETLTDGVELVQIEADNYPSFTAKAGLRTVPAMLFVNNGNIVETVLGVQTDTSAWDAALKNAKKAKVAKGDLNISAERIANLAKAAAKAAEKKAKDEKAAKASESTAPVAPAATAPAESTEGATA